LAIQQWQMFIEESNSFQPKEKIITCLETQL